MKILGISGSPVKNGITLKLLDKALEGAGSRGAVCTKVILNDLNFSPCQGCGGCNDSGTCVLNDDLKTLYGMLDNFDAVIVSSPVYFGSISAQTKMMIDRMQAMWIRKYVLKNIDLSRKRNGIFICAAGSDKKEFFEASSEIMRIMFATLNIAYAGELFVPNSGKIDIAGDGKAILDKAFDMGATLVS